MIVDIIFVALVIILIFAIYRIKFKNEAAKIATAQIPEVRPEPIVQNRQVNANAPRWAQPEPESEGSSEEDKEEGEGATLMDRKRQLRKEEKAKQKQQRKEALNYMLQEQKQKREKQEQQEEQKERIEEEKRQKEEQYYRMLAQEEQKKKKAEYDKWKGMFKVEDEGKAKESAEVEAMRKEQLLKNLLKVLQKSKLSLLQDLAHKFKLSTNEVIEKIKELESRQEVKGIFDQRGKYMVIEQKEWDAIKNYVQARGRLKKTDIMQECARIIKIPESTDIDQEILSLIEKEGEAAS